MRAIALIGLALVVAACSGWPSEPYSYHQATSVPTRTPRVQTPTPLVLSPTFAAVATDTATPDATAERVTPTASQVPTYTNTPAPTEIALRILGCDTDLDVLHGMGEVTNAYVTVSNPTSADVSNLCTTLRGLDEARPHPDKTKCLPTLPSGYQATLKLTVDTTYKEDTPIQIDVTSGDALLLRAGEPACTAVGLLLPDVGELGTLKPIP